MARIVRCCASPWATNTSRPVTPASAANHLKQAVVLDPKYSAAWKQLGRALVESGQPADALLAYREGIAVAEAKGDKQAAKEMTVYARRIEKSVHDDRK